VIFYFTYEYRFKRLLARMRRPLKPITRHMRSCAASAEAKAAKEHRYAWLRTRVRKLVTGVLWS
jgi:hypothetical protein